MQSFTRHPATPVRKISLFALLLAALLLFGSGAARAERGHSEHAPARPFFVTNLFTAPLVPPPSFSLSIEGDLDLGGFIFKGGQAFIHTDGTSTLSTAVGMGALLSTTPGTPQPFNGTKNTALGSLALADTTTGYENTASGHAALNANTEGSQNTAVGAFALVTNMTGSFNTAVGSAALMSNLDGSQNSAFGWGALTGNLDGTQNTGIGEAALVGNTSGNANTALGASAMVKNTMGSFNTALGIGALNLNVTGSSNTAVGSEALNVNTGSDNIALGRNAGLAATTGSQNIFIGNQGLAADANSIKIGDANHTMTYISGIVGVTLPMSGATVFVDNNNQLGTISSSRRFKEEIEDLADSTSVVASLRPVTFRYTEETVGPGPRPKQFGLIAEEVEETLPELVVYDAEGRPYSVNYLALTPLLLNEIQRLSQRVVELESRDLRLDRLEAELAELRERKR